MIVEPKLHVSRGHFASIMERAVGQGLRPPEWLAEVRDARRREVAAPTFSPDGLYFVGPVYGPQWGLPDSVAAFDWLPG